MTAGHGEAMVSNDCPLCQMAAEFSGPMFWHLDGCNNDNDFPFSVYCRTRREVGKRTAAARGVRARVRGTAAAPAGGDAGRLARQRRGAGESIWQRSFVNARANDTRAMDRVVRDWLPPGGAERGCGDFARHG